MSLLTASTALRSGFSALRANPLRTFLSALGVVIGVGAMISVLALSDGVEASIRRQLAADGRALTIRLAPRTSELVDGIVMAKSDAPTFTLADAESLEAVVGTLGTVDVNSGGQGLVTVAPGRRPRGMLVRGVRIAPASLRERPPAAGRFFTPAEVRSGARVLVLSDGLAAALAASLVDSTAGPVTIPMGRGADRAAARAAVPSRAQPTAAECHALVGRDVTVRDAAWKIVGILAPARDAEPECSGKPAARPAMLGGARGSARPLAFVPASAFSQAAVTDPVTVGGVPQPTSPTTLMLAAHRIEDVPALRAAAERWLAGRYGAPNGVGAAATGGWKDRVDVGSYERESASIREGMLMFRLLMSAITGISLVVGGVGIMNVLLASVTERTREIGISKAVGARRRDVLAQYLAESIAIAGLGAVLGTALGYGVAQLVAAVMRAQVNAPVHAGFSVSTFFVAVGAPLVVGLCFGMYPALRASRLSPIDAIRHE